ncbi:MAG: copper resistance protein CopC, partial [Exiguobacterium acetylicum]
TEGKYTIKWASISDDGHPVKGTIRFTVLGATKVETSTVEKAEPMETKASVVPEAEPVSKGLVPTLLPWVVGGLLISIVILLLLRRRTT